MKNKIFLCEFLVSSCLSGKKTRLFDHATRMSPTKISSSDQRVIRLGIQLVVPTVVSVMMFSEHLRAQDKFSFDGYIATTATTVYKALHPDIFYHAKIEVQYDVTKSIEAQVQIKGQSNEGEKIRFREANIRVKLNKEDKIKVGNLKKPIGDEELYSEEDLVTIDRTYIYNYLSPMNHVGRDIGVQFIHEPDEKGLEYNLGVYLNNSSTFAATARLASYDLLSPVVLSVSSVFQNLRLDEGVSIATVLGNLSVSRTGERVSWVGESFYGIDPYASRFAQLETGSSTKKVWFASAKAIASYFIPTGNEREGVEPLVLFGYLLPDTRNSKIYTLEFIMGMNYYLNKHTRARINVHPLLSKNGVDEAFSQTGSSVSLEFQLRW